MKKNLQNGATMLEAMVALFVLAIGLMGMFSLQVKAVKGSQTADEYRRASIMANELMELMLVSREPDAFIVASKNGIPGFDGNTPPVCFGPGKACSVAETIDYQYNLWGAKLLSELPTSNIVVDVADSTLAGVSVKKATLTLSFVADITQKNSLNENATKEIDHYQQREEIVLEGYL